jgi:hypothetical protein
VVPLSVALVVVSMTFAFLLVYGPGWLTVLVGLASVGLLILIWLEGRRRVWLTPGVAAVVQGMTLLDAVPDPIKNRIPLSRFEQLSRNLTLSARRWILDHLPRRTRTMLSWQERDAAWQRDSMRVRVRVSSRV